MRQTDGPKETPRDVLGDDLWALLGRASDPPAARSSEHAPLINVSETDAREVLGDDLWALLGQASPPPIPRIADPPAAPPPRALWRALGVALLAASIPFVVVPLLRVPQAEPDDLSLIRDLDLASNLDLLSHPDFETLVLWDGSAP